MNMNGNRIVEVLTFAKGRLTATIATDGVRHVTQERERCIEHKTLRRAIAHLAYRGYKINTETCYQI